jgi:hypothetical protein
MSYQNSPPSRKFRSFGGGKKEKKKTKKKWAHPYIVGRKATSLATAFLLNEMFADLAFM